ncbi:enoyl-CoA hydratase-related protein [Pendulispora rubella]|uniref:Enoyl-CoA hydratase-related protein n=1 Tax=Pendulispora rubella TaxID=2741070 RepID=A0ABZ2KSN0_9BACT
MDWPSFWSWVLLTPEPASAASYARPRTRESFLLARAIPNEPVARRSLLKAATVLGGLSTLGLEACAHPSATAGAASAAAIHELTMADTPLASGSKVTVERRGQVVLIGLNRPEIHNRLDPEAFTLLAVVHGDTWNMGHEIDLAADIRIAAANTRYGQDENTHGRFPGGGSTVRFVREAGWGNAMRYMLTGDHWSADEALRMGVVQAVHSTQEAALQAGIEMANKIAACGPLGIQSTLESAHLAIDESDQQALSKLDTQYGALYKTQDFLEGRNAEAEGRPPVYRGR